MNLSNQQDLRQVLGKFLTGVTVVTTLDRHGVPVGFTANSFTSVSLQPPLVLVCLAQSAGLAPVFRRARAFAVNILSTDQEALSNGFAQKDADRFADVEWRGETTGSPVLAGSAAWLDCEMYEKIIAGDHIIFIGRIVDAEKNSRNPLGYYQGRYCAIDLPEETMNQIEQRESADSSTGLLVDYRNQLLLIRDQNGQFDVPRAAPVSEGEEPRINYAMKKLGIESYNKALFSVVEGRHHEHISIYYRVAVETAGPLPEGAEYFTPDTLPYDQLCRPDLSGVIRRYLVEKQSGQFGIYVGDEKQGQIEQITERKI